MCILLHFIQLVRNTINLGGFLTLTSAPKQDQAVGLVPCNESS